MDWIKDNSEVLQLGLGLVSAVVWLGYLQILYLGFARQRQAVVMIHHGAAEDDRARCTVSNMGTEPIYVMALLAKLTIDGKTVNATVTDREELAFEDLETPISRTTQGPLKSGEYMDVGSFSDLIWRAQQRNGVSDASLTDEIEVSVVAASGHASKLVVANRTFQRRKDDDGAVHFIPTSVLTKQIRGPWTRRKLLRRANLVA